MNNSSLFHTWQNYWGLLHKETFSESQLSVFGFETETQSSQNKFVFDKEQALFGFIHQGQARVQFKDMEWALEKGQWFCIPGPAQLSLATASRVFVVGDSHHKALTSMGGPIEAEGRLRYIDGCTDTLLYSPPVQGDPCLNLLHFPSKVNQTMHLHPSSRIGIISGGTGSCTTPHGEIPLTSGMIFVLPKNIPHRFLTQRSTLDVITFHPDSDWGPTHEEHPMINRTWVVD